MAFGSVNIGGGTKKAAIDIAYNNSVPCVELSNVQSALDKSFDIVLPSLTVTVIAGSAITLTDGLHTITGISGEDGTFTTKLPALGMWTATATLGGESTDGSIDITTLGNDYTLALAYFPEILEENTPAQIQKAAQLGIAPDLWSVGDTHTVTLNGTVGSLELNNETYCAFILGFDHNSSVEGGNSIHFQFGKNASGTDIAFVDSNYDSTSGSAGFRMNMSNTNSLGWNGSYMHETICPAFLNAMPTEWQNVIVACTKYSDNSGGGSDTARYVTATQDKIWLLAEFEVFGTRYGANSAERDYQKQYDYYKNGNSCVKHKHGAIGTACVWWLRSVYAAGRYSFQLVDKNGNSDSYLSDARYSKGFAPGFKVA